MTIQNNQSIQFGICLSNGDEEEHHLVPVDDSVQKTLSEMLETFNSCYLEDIKKHYEPSEKYSATEPLFISTNNENVVELKALFYNTSLKPNNINLAKALPDIEYYFAIFNQGNKKILGIKRPAQFKGLLKNKNKLVQIYDDTLKSVNDNIFKLDNDFDFVVSQDEIKILHPSGFVFIADVDKYIAEKSAAAAIGLGAQIKFVNFVNISKFVSRSKTAAKLIASINSRNDLHKLNKSKLSKFCKNTGIIIKKNGDEIEPEEEHIIDFLYILDRRLYEMDITDERELYLAESRHKK